MVEITEPHWRPKLFVHLNTGATSFIARVRPTAHFTIGQKARVAFHTEKSHLFYPATGRAGDHKAEKAGRLKAEG